MTDQKKALAAVLFSLLLVLVVVFLIKSGRERIRTAGASPTAAASSVSAAAERPMKKATLFFPREDDGLFVAEERDIPAGPSMDDEAEAVLAELIKGPSGDLVAPLPPETKVGRLFITKDGTAYVDFTRDFVDKHPSGTDAEISTVYAVVNTLAYNFKAVKKVFILVDGEERETLAGHLSLDHPFFPDYSRNVKR